MMMSEKETKLTRDDFIISETDAEGNIVLANEDFLRISEYSQDELIGQPHNMVRHPDMPKAAFKGLWETLKRGEVWTGYVKNQTKSGGFYWVYATVTPIETFDGKLGYLSCRKQATDEEIHRMGELYKTMH